MCEWNLYHPLSILCLAVCHCIFGNGLRGLFQLFALICDVHYIGASICGGIFLALSLLGLFGCILHVQDKWQMASFSSSSPKMQFHLLYLTVKFSA